MKFKDYIKKLFGELAVISIIPLLFVVNLLLFNWKNIKFNNVNLMIFIMVLVCTAAIEVAYVLMNFTAVTYDKIEEFVKKHKWMLLVIIVIFLSRIPYMTALPRWDSAEYYYRLTQGLRECDFASFKDFQQNFALCGHPTLAFSVIYLIGEMIFKGNVIGVNTVQMVLTLSAFWCVYRILKKMLKKTTYKNVAVYTLILSFAPLVYSSFAYFTPDYAMAVFVIYVIYACVYQKPLIAGFFSMVCFQTKETGIVLIGGFAIGIIIHYFLKFSNRRNPDKSAIVEMFKDARLYCILIAALIQLLYNKFIGGVSQWTQNQSETAGLRWDNNGTNCLGINFDYIIVKLKQQFVLNFNWLIAGLIVAGCIYYFIKNKKRLRLNLKYIEIIAAFTAYVAFSCIYITAALARYNVVGDLLLYIILFGVLNKAIDNKKQLCVSAVVGILVLAECFMTIDIVTLNAFLKLSLGNTDIMYVGNSDESLYYGDYMIYNTQFLMVNSAIDKILKNTGYDPDTYDAVVSDMNGACITGNSAVFLYNWDSKKQKRVFYENENTVKMPETMDVRRLFQNKLKDRGVLIYLPYNNDVPKDEMIEKASKYYEVGEEQVIWTLQGCVYYYELVNLNDE